MDGDAVLPVAKARVVLMASGRVETVRLTLTCRDTVHWPISFFFFFLLERGGHCS